MTDLEVWYYDSMQQALCRRASKADTRYCAIVEHELNLEWLMLNLPFSLLISLSHVTEAGKSLASETRL